VGHEDAEDTVAFAQECIDGALKSVTDIYRLGIVIERAGVAVMNDNQFRIGTLRDKMIRESLQAGGHVDAELIDAGEMAEVLHRAGHIGEDDIRQAPAGKTVSAPNVFEQRLTPGFNITSGVNGDGAVVNELGGLNAAGQKAKKQHCNGSDHL